MRQPAITGGAFDWMMTMIDFHHVGDAVPDSECAIVG